VKTKNAYVYLARFRGDWMSCSSLTLASARSARASDIRNGWPVSAIVKVAVPLPEKEKNRG
jgi:hypothetical protein